MSIFRGEDHLRVGQQVVQGVAGRRQNLRTAPTPNPTGVFPEGDVTDPMKVVLDGPVLPIELQQSSRTRIHRTQARDSVDRFLLDASVGEPTDAVELKHLGDTRPVGQVLR